VQDPFTKVYGDADPALTYTAGGLKFADTAAGVLSGGLARNPGSSGRTHNVTQGTLAANRNYTLTLYGTTLGITPRPLSVVANSKTKTYGAPNPTLDGTLTGVVGGDGISASYTTTATQFSDVVAGGYPIVPGLNDPNGKLANYTVSPTN